MKKVLLALVLGLLAVSMADAGGRGRRGRRWRGRRGCITKCDPCPEDCGPGPKPCCYKTVEIEPTLMEEKRPDIVRLVPQPCLEERIEQTPIKYWSCNSDCEGKCC